ncbi:transcriptional regulator [Cytobacillus depressus]|uniref:Transcriptional regulator n=1 Tax=Cytobacillus depressus TaxID=1602942 RepID=A0A6L3VAV9_9BACI|nr:transcriptional regulator [Cytobacillus depressus]KAB2337669.1 transcriptional regulator [Cytobacillus depressus]
MHKDKLTKRQLEIFAAINTYVDEHGYAPSVRDIGKMVNLASSSTVQGYLERLKLKGYITWLPGQPRTLRIIKTAS